MKLAYTQVYMVFPAIQLLLSCQQFTSQSHCSRHSSLGDTIDWPSPFYPSYFCWGLLHLSMHLSKWDSSTNHSPHGWFLHCWTALLKTLNFFGCSVWPLKQRENARGQWTDGVATWTPPLPETVSHPSVRILDLTCLEVLQGHLWNSAHQNVNLDLGMIITSHFQGIIPNALGILHSAWSYHHVQLPEIVFWQHIPTYGITKHYAA